MIFPVRPGRVLLRMNSWVIQEHKYFYHTLGSLIVWLFWGYFFSPLCDKDKQLSSFLFSNPQSSRSRWRCCSLLRNMAGSRRRPAPVTWGRTMPLLTASRQLSLIPAGGRPPRKQPSPASQVASRHLCLQCLSTNSGEIRSRLFYRIFCRVFCIHT